MIVKEVEKAFNEQILVEGYSSQLYLAMASWCETKGMAGTAKFLYAHAEEERMHMMKLIHYLNDRGGHAVIAALKAPPKDYKDVFVIFSEIMQHEEYVTACINKLLEVTMKAKDYNTANFLQWFVMEQVEEESLFHGILDKIELMGRTKAAYYLLDKELSGLS